MKQVGTFEAKNQFSALLELVAQGEDVLITRHGKPIARLVPPEGSQSKQNAQLAIDRIRARARELNLGPLDWEEWKAYRDEGRR